MVVSVQGKVPKVGISEVISRVTVVTIPLRGLITPLITAHEPPSKAPNLFSRGRLGSAAHHTWAPQSLRASAADVGVFGILGSPIQTFKAPK